MGGDACADEAFHAWFRDKDPKWDNARSSELGPAPGYVTGGPNKEYCKGYFNDPKEDHACTRSAVRDQPPGKAYVDTNTSWEPKNPYDKSWELTEPVLPPAMNTFAPLGLTATAFATSTLSPGPL